MADWTFVFRRSESLPVPQWADALSTFVGAPVITTLGPIIGNPRDFYIRNITITSEGLRDGLSVEMRLLQSLLGEDDPDPITDSARITLVGDAPIATKLVAWRALREILAAVGCTDITLQEQHCHDLIIGDVIAAGETELAAKLRAEAKA